MARPYKSPWAIQQEYDTRPSHGMMSWIKRTLGGWFGARPSLGTLAEEAVTREKLAGGPRGVAMPWFLPYDEYDSGTGETAIMRQAYRRMVSSPAVKAALFGKLFGVASLKLQIHPADKRNKRDRETAKFTHWDLTRRLSGGVSGMIWNILSGACVDGYSVNEKVFNPQLHGNYAGKIPLTAFKMKDVGFDLVPKTDEFRNITSFLGLRYNGGLEFDPSLFVTYSHLKMYERPSGMSDLRASYEAYWLIDTTWKLRRIGLTTKAWPLLKGTYSDPATQDSLNDALRKAKSLSYLTIPDTMMVEALELAGTSEDHFRNTIQDLREEVFLGICGAILQALTGGKNVQRGDSRVHRDSANLFPWFLSENICNLLNDQDNGLIKDLVDLNYMVSDYPYATLSAVDPEEMKAELEIDQGLKSLGLDLSKEATYVRYAREPWDPAEPEDRLAGDTPILPDSEGGANNGTAPVKKPGTLAAPVNGL